MTTTHRDTEVLLREFIEHVNAGDFEALEALFAEGYGEEPDRRTATEEVDIERLYRGAFPDYHEEVHVVASDGNEAVAFVTATGTHEGEYYNLPPTGNEFEVPVFRYVEATDSEIASLLATGNMLEILEDLGVDVGALAEDIPAYVTEA